MGKQKQGQRRNQKRSQKRSQSQDQNQETSILSGKVFLGWRKFVLFVIGAVLLYCGKLSADVYTYLSILVITAYAGERVSRFEHEWQRLLYSKTLIGLRSLLVAVIGTVFLWLEKIDSIQWLTIAGAYLLGNSFEWAITRIRNRIEND